MGPLKRRALTLVLPCFLGFAAGTAAGQVGRFDLLGPRIDVHVTRGDNSLPISSVPNLQPGDKLQVHADLPETQSVHLLLVIAFLRGSTNPPPDKWFTRIETWDKRTRNEGVTVSVPAEAQQALIFVAPETGGDFSTLKSAVRGRPGVFVRASQDLNEASFEQSRIERYAQALLQVPTDSPAQLLDHSRKLAATLNLKQNDDCFKLAADAQLTCLRQTGTALLLDDGHGQNLAQILTTGPSSDLIGAVAGTPMATQAGVASYSAYVGTVLDVVRLMTGLHTAHFQYIPAIAFPDGDALNLRLNTAPSFHDPKSVIVIALPAIQKAVPPPLQLQNARHVSCLLQPRMVLPLNGAPLVFATGFAHDLVLHLDKPSADGRTDIPLVPDAYEGGLIVTSEKERKVLGASAPPARDAAPPVTAAANAIKKDEPPAHAQDTSHEHTGPVEITGTVQGYWGFDHFSGPAVPLQQLPGSHWEAAQHNELFTGKTNTLTLDADGIACTRSVTLSNAPEIPLEWHRDEKGPANALLVKLPLERAAPGKLSLEVRQYGESDAIAVPLQTYADVFRPQDLRIHAGDQFATLTGTGLGEVKSLDLNGRMLLPSPDSSRDGKSLRLVTASETHDSEKSAKKLKAFSDGDRGTGLVILRDGRSVPVPFLVDAARPAVTLLSMTVVPGTTGLTLNLTNKEAIPLASRVTFSLRSDSPAKFRRSTKIEVATTDGTLLTTLALADGAVVLQDSHTALAFFSPEKAFGASAFGPLQFRVLAEDTASDWQSLGTLVRTPIVQQLTCSARSAKAALPSVSATAASPELGTAPADMPCTLSGSGLYLIQNASADATGAVSVEEPAGFGGDTLQVPRPADGHTLFLRLRDDPEHNVSLQVEAVERHQSRNASQTRPANAGF